MSIPLPQKKELMLAMVTNLQCVQIEYNSQKTLIQQAENSEAKLKFLVTF